MLLKTGTIVRVTYAHENMGTHYRPVTEDGMYIRTLPNGLEEILLPNGCFAHAPSGTVAIRSLLDSPFYKQVRAELFPALAPGEEFSIGPSVNVPNEAENLIDRARPVQAA